MVGDADGDPLVDPKARAELPNAKREGQSEQADDRGRGGAGGPQAARAGGFGTSEATVLTPARV